MGGTLGRPSIHRSTGEGSGGSLAELERKLELAGSDIATLQFLVGRLGRFDDDHGMAVWMRAAQRLADAKRAAATSGSSPVGSFLARRKLARRTGKALHRYRMEVSEFDALKIYLSGARKLGRLDRVEDLDAAAFVLFGAEWFRRSFSGGVAKWSDLAAAIGGPVPYPTLTALTREGLRWWRRPVRQHNGANEWFLTLRLEGGFPSRLLETQERGWLLSHLRGLVSGLSNGPCHEEEAVALAEADAGVPPSFRTKDFAAVCAELALAIVRLRIEHGPGAAEAGVPRLSAYLDACEPAWRSKLGIEGKGASKLVDDLVSDSLQRLGSATAKCRRLLVRVGEVWIPALDLGMEGVPSLPKEVFHGTSRLHGFPAGDLADMLSGPLCVVEPSDDGRPWVAIPRRSAPRGPLQGFPFAATAAVELRTDGKAVRTVTWAGGEPVRSEVLTFVSDEAEEPSSLVLAATGSCRSRRNVVYTRSPASFEARDPATGERVEPIWTGDGFSLHRLTAATHVGAPGDDLFFRIQPGADNDDADHLTIRGPEVLGLATADGDPVYAGAPEVMTHVGNIGTHHVDDVRWRTLGGSRWRDLAREQPRGGMVEIVWLDPSSRAAKDRRQVTILPEGTALRREVDGKSGARYELTGAGDWAVVPGFHPRVAVTHVDASLGARAWTVEWHGPAERRVPLRLCNGTGHVADVVAPFPFGTGRFLRADGTAFGTGKVILDHLRGARAATDNKGALLIETHGPGAKMIHRRAFSDDLPLWSLRDAVSALMAEAGDLDSEARISFEPTGARLVVGRYELLPLATGPGRLTLLPMKSPTPGGLTVRWRSLLDMGSDGVRDLAVVAEEVCAAGHVEQVTADIAGPGVAYLVDHNKVLSRPIIFNGSRREAAGLSRLRQAVLVEARHDREAAFDAAVRALEAEAFDEGDIQWLLSHLTIPDPLAASTFQAFNTLARHPRMLAALAAFACKSDDAALRDRVWGLEQELPFLWTLVGVDDWIQAFAWLRSCTYARLEALGLGAAAAGLADQVVSSAAETCVSFDDALRATFCLTGLVTAAPPTSRALAALGQEYLQRSGAESNDALSASCFDRPNLRPAMMASHPWIYGFHPCHHEGLEAPVVAASVAGGRLFGIDGRQRLCIRQAVARDPQYFADAYSATIRLLALGR